MSMASAVMHGLQLGGSQAQMEWERQQQMGALMRHLAEQRATQQLNAQQLNQFLPPPPMQPMQTPLGESGGAIDLGQQVQPVDPHAEFRAAFADAPPEGQQHVLGGYQAAQRTSMVGQAQQRLEQEQFDKDMGEITAARKIGFSPEHDNLDQVPGVLAKYHKYGIPTKNPQPYTQGMVGGAMKRDPMAVAQMLNRGSMPPGLMPSANAPGEVDPQDLQDAQSQDPVIRAAAQARLANSRNVPLIRATAAKAGAALPPTAEEADRQTTEIIRIMGGPEKVPPSIAAQIHIQVMQGKKISDGTLARWSQQPRDLQRVQESHFKMRFDAANQEVRNRQRAVNEALKFAGGDDQRAQKENPAAFTKLNAAKAYRDSLLEEHDDTPEQIGQPLPPGNTATEAAQRARNPQAAGVGGMSGPSGAVMSKEQAVDQAWSELGQDADPAAVKARVQELIGGGR